MGDPDCISHLFHGNQWVVLGQMHRLTNLTRLLCAQNRGKGSHVSHLRERKGRNKLSESIKFITVCLFQEVGASVIQGEDICEDNSF